MKSHEAFPSNYLKAADLNGKRPIVTITHVTSEDLGGDTKRAVHFKGTDKILILNRTNWNTIAEVTGQDDDENWTGHQVVLYATKVDFQGKRTDAIRVEAPPRTKPATKPATEATADEVFGTKKPVSSTGLGDNDEDAVPF